MKKIVLMLAVLVLANSIVGCSSKEDDGKINLPISSNDLKNANFQDVVAKFENAGFTNVQTEVIDDLVLGWFTKDGEIEKVSVDGYTSFSTNSRYPADTEIVVSYHTFPADKEQEVAASSTPESTAEAEPTEKAQPTEKVQYTEVTQSTEETQSSAEEEILTIENNEDMAALFKVSDGDPLISEFAKKYSGRTIQFDGYIADIASFYEDKTRFDILIYTGNSGESSGNALNFKFENINIVYDLKLTGSNIPENISEGQNLRITAKVNEYKEISALFFLTLVSTEIR